jgi:hypothetical protein
MGEGRGICLGVVRMEEGKRREEEEGKSRVWNVGRRIWLFKRMTTDGSRANETALHTAALHRTHYLSYITI